ncbi:hypothetical protein [Comamonas terrigena]|uniref:hypothetical protein n=1 Tax=Comamonas terrigena TaxID=32013 RepID=UPI00289EDCBF|nr:hypothetical protein [Comamonas terrigena]
MSKLLPRTASVTLEDGETLDIRPLTAVEILRMTGFFRAQLANMGEGKQVMDVLIDAIASSEKEVMTLISLSTGKTMQWALSLSLVDLLAVGVEIVTLNISAQKKVPDLLSQLMDRLAPSQS